MNTFDIVVSGQFSLAETCAPVSWGGGRWPNHDWIDGQLVSVSRDARGSVIRLIRQSGQYGDTLSIRTNRDDVDHQLWARIVLGTDRIAPAIDDPVVAEIAASYPGMRPFSNSSLFEGIVTAIIGQSISVQAAAVTERKLAALYSPPIEIGTRLYWPFPSVEQLAASEGAVVRESGVTQRRADAIVHIARRFRDGEFDPLGDGAPETEIYDAVLALPQVGRWTAESVLLWGLGADDAYPIGDVALLRAARRAYGEPEMTHRQMDALSDQWRPGRSWAARWLWLNLFGPSPHG